ncbi:MAG: methyltransferase [Ruminococcus sp.]|nr:methyltransferase [Ruminococcus sp.]
MDKILTEVYLPASGRTYEIYLNGDMYVYEAVQLLTDILSEISGGFFCGSGSDVLCSREDGTIYDFDKKLSELGIKNHSRLMIL